MAELTELLDLADVAVVRSQGILSEPDRASVAEVCRRVRMRAGYLGEGLVIALAGGTGSGKSSLLNALVGADVVNVGIVRPTTKIAVAAVPKGDIPLSRLIDDLDIGSVVTTESKDRIVYVDLPDFDSIEHAHRHIVEKVLPVVDAVVWVLDPEKYADPVVHDDFLVSLSAYGEQFVFALNQADRLTEGASDAADDLQRRLIADGIANPAVVLTVARDDVDTEDLRAAIEHRLQTKRTALSKLVVDLRSVANESWSRCDAQIDDRSGADATDAALAAATFISLGVEAYDFYVSIESRG
ncbi:MAG: hypothetical protein BMS9Abin17_1071 [Acidimicrobiia bacterium]|nr:MAG: hypothetical protein BMS9Abin17_1071 [Acidimicrobiia bacterium]